MPEADRNLICLSEIHRLPLSYVVMLTYEHFYVTYKHLQNHILCILVSLLRLSPDGIFAEIFGIFGSLVFNVSVTSNGIGRVSRQKYSLDKTLIIYQIFQALCISLLLLCSYSRWMPDIPICLAETGARLLLCVTFT